MADRRSEVVKKLFSSLSLEDIDIFPVRRLKQLLASIGVDASRFLEKEELVERVKEEVRRFRGYRGDGVQQQGPAEQAQPSNTNPADQDGISLVEIESLITSGVTKEGSEDVDIEKVFKLYQMLIRLGNRVPRDKTIWAKVKLAKIYLGIFNTGQKLENGNFFTSSAFIHEDEVNAKYKDPPKAKELLDSVLAEDKRHGEALYYMYIYYSSPYGSSEEEADNRQAIKYLHRSAKAGCALALDTIALSRAIVKCGNCNQTDLQKLRLCANCDGVFYCSRRCQKAGWQAHKTHCRPSAMKETWQELGALAKLFRPKLAQAIKLTEEGKYEESERLFEEIMGMDFACSPEDKLIATATLGRHCVIWGQNERALPLLDEFLSANEKIVRRCPETLQVNGEGMYQAYMSRGVARWHAGRAAEGEADLAAGARLYPGRADPGELLHELRLGLRPLDKVRRARCGALREQARARAAALWEDPPRHPGRAAFEEAVRLCSAALAAHDDADTHNLLAQMYSLTAADDRAAAHHFEREVEIRGKLLALPRNRAGPTAARLAFQLSNAEYFLALAQLNLGRREEGLRGLEAWASRGATEVERERRRQEVRQEVRQAAEVLDAMGGRRNVNVRFGISAGPPPADGEEG